MKAQEIRELTQDELNKRENELKEEIFNLRIQVATQQTTNVARIGNLKKDLARVITIKKEKGIN
ncbi:MAG: 50S ribosomal protein L29 [Candidatus Dadabacteria bacterium]|jgi:large subunit ribosomal protein L29|nr:MAG: 50S ribosomal protein L29 [Thermodesulfobacteriales bacterium]